MTTRSFITFPEGFVWGSATSAYQIEGSFNTDERSLSIWDTFSHTPGKTRNGDTGDVACDHYCRMSDDIQLISDLNHNAYRFSVAWPRIQPAGMGAANPAGLDFYDRLVDGLLAKDIDPYLTLYHWDLPQVLQDAGGWTVRDTALRFADFAEMVARRLGDRVNYWTTLNEPFVAAMAGYFTGEHAPGIQDVTAAVKAVHHLLLAHGYAVPRIRTAAARPVEVGITLNLTSVHSASGAEADRQAARRFDGIQNRMFLDALFCAEYPNDMVELFGPILPPIGADDMSVISAELDFLGVNYYNRTVMRYNPEMFLVNFSDVHPEGHEYTLLWEIYPQGLYETLMRVWNDYHLPKLFVTENGAAMPDGVDADQRIRDVRRTRFLRDHLIQCHRAIQDGAPLKGYFAWSLMDNFEWAYGYEMRFGLVYVDFATQRRMIKDSGYWYRQVIQENGFDPMAGKPFFPR